MEKPTVLRLLLTLCALSLIVSRAASSSSPSSALIAKNVADDPENATVVDDVANGTCADTEEEESTSEEEAADTYVLANNIAGIFIILGVSGIGIIGTIILGSIRHLRGNQTILLMLQLFKFFGLGVILATAWIHMMVEAFANFMNEEVLAGTGWERYGPGFVGLFAMIAGFTVQLIEFIGISRDDRKHAKERERARAPIRDVETGTAKPLPPASDTKPAAAAVVVGDEKPVAGVPPTRGHHSRHNSNGSVGGGGSSKLAGSRDGGAKAGDVAMIGGIALDPLDAACPVKDCQSASHASDREGRRSPGGGSSAGGSSSGRHHRRHRRRSPAPTDDYDEQQRRDEANQLEEVSDDVPEFPEPEPAVTLNSVVGHSHAPEDLGSLREIGTLMLELGIIFHSVIIGVALGVAGEEWHSLIVAISFHQLFEGMALGSRIAELKYKTAFKVGVLGMLYPLTTPVGIAIGIGVHSTYDEHSLTGVLVTGIFDSLSAGILIYNGYVELMAVEMNHSRTFRSQGGWRKVASFFAMYLGASAMAVVGLWA